MSSLRDGIGVQEELKVEMVNCSDPTPVQTVPVSRAFLETLANRLDALRVYLNKLHLEETAQEIRKLLE